MPPIIIHSATFIKSAPSIKDAPETGGLPEFVMVGRSNVGKSSCINSLTNHKSLAKTSNTPGKTRLINFYDINHQFYLVDLPGYGYAKVSHAEQERWRKNLETYLLKREEIRLILQMVDARHGPQPSDIQMMTWLSHHEVPWVMVLTKVDKVSKQVGRQLVSKTAQDLGLPPDQIIAFSAQTHLGRDALWEVIAEALEDDDSE